MSKFDACIVGGVGRAGLPLGLSLAQQGRSVILYDKNRDAVDQINDGIMPFRENNGDEVLCEVKRSKRLFATDNPTLISESEAVIVVIDTPIQSSGGSGKGVVIDLLAELSPHLRNHQLLVLRSTVKPGTTAEARNYLQSVGCSADVSYCPERLAEGNGLEEIRLLPQIVSGFSRQATERAKALFLKLTPNIEVLEPEEAELAKLFTNAWRYISFAISNELFAIAEGHGLDFHRIYSSITRSYPRLGGFAPPGFTAGPCLLKDTQHLIAYCEQEFLLGMAALKVNEHMPDMIVAHLREKFNLAEMTVGILGMAFKADSDDGRGSLSYRLMETLMPLVKTVICTDPYIVDASFVSLEQFLTDSELIVLGAPHRVYSSIRFGGTPVVDIWNYYGRGGGLR